MAVPSSNSHVRNTTGGAFSSQTQGGTIINNDNTGDVITKSFQLNAAVADNTDSSVLPSIGASGIYNVAKPLSGGTFAYQAEGKYVIARSSDTLSGVSNTKLLFMGAGDKLPIARFRGDFGAKLLTAFRNNQFSWNHTLDSGAKITNMRVNWLNSAGTAAASPTSLNGTNMWDPVAGATSANSDSAANPTRAVPGELVMKVDFVTTNISSGGDFFDYAPITGM
tara:strand:+ start:4067 stop:4735 length:669 start_codon:yes stop_codon:yes gene_type:complete